MTSTTPTASVRLRRLVPAALLAAALGAGTLTDPAIASAAPKWDVADYDDCVADEIAWEIWHDRDPAQIIDSIMKMCCDGSGGLWNAEQAKCEAPPADVQRPLPPRVAPSAETSAPLQPGQP